MCCLGPVLLVLVGLGSLGFGALLGRYHWWFIGVAMALLTYAWRSYVKETRRCRTEACEMVQGKTTKTVLILASAVVAAFVGLNLYTYAGHHRTDARPGPAPGLAQVIIPVEGMTCATCELTVASSLKRLPGVHVVKARVTDQMARVDYDPSKVTVEQMLAAINRTGYRARRPEEQR